MAETSNSSRLLGNSVWNGAAFVVGAGLNLVVLPFVVSRLGIAAFGMAGLVTACVAPALIFSNALALSASREFAQHLSADQRNIARHFFASAMLLALAIGSIIVMVLAFAGPPLARFAFNLSSEMVQDLSLAFLFSSGGWFCQCVSSILLALFAARQNYSRISLISMLSTLVATMTTLVFVPQRPMASTFLACQTSGFFVTLIASFILSRRLFGEWLAAPAFYRDPLGHLIRFGGWQLVAQGGALVSGQVDRYLLGALLPTQFVGFYAIAQRLEEAVYIGILKVGEILFPFFSVLQEETIDRKADLLFRSSWVLNLLAASALGGFIPIAGPLLRQWTNAEVAVQAEQVLVVLLIAGMLGCSANVFVFYLLASGASRYNALIAMVTAMFTFATSALALPIFGWQAAGWSACAGMVAQVVTVALLLRKAFDHTGLWSRFSHFVIAPLFAGVVTALLLRYLGNERLFNHLTHWWCLAALYCAGATIILIVAVVMSQMGPYRDTCRRDLRVIASRFLPGKAI